MSEHHRQYGLSPNIRTRPATVLCDPCPRCGTPYAVERRGGVFCVYCSAPATGATPAPLEQLQERADYDDA